jgi:hypothetical protein
LLAQGVPADRPDLNGNTPLHCAVRSRRPRIVRLLLDHGINTAAVNHLGQTALGIALRQESYAEWQRQSRAEIIGLLQAAGAPAAVIYPVAADGPRPIDMQALRQAAADLPGDQATVHKVLQPDYSSYQELAGTLLRGDADCFLPVLALCAAVLGPGTAKTLDGGQLDEPFFHHGDLVVTGHLDVRTALLVTGSLTVDGCVTDCVAATVQADDHFDLDTYEQGYGEGVQDRLRALLVGEVFTRDDDDDDESRLDAQELFSCLRAGRPVFRAG